MAFNCSVWNIGSSLLSLQLNVWQAVLAAVSLFLQHRYRVGTGTLTDFLLMQGLATFPMLVRACSYPNALISDHCNP